MILVILLSVITVFIVIVPILVFMCTETEEQPPSIDYEYKREQRKQPDIAKPSDDIQKFEDNADEISVNADFHAFKSDGKKPSKDPESPENLDEVGFNIGNDIQKQSDPSDTGYTYSDYS